MGWDSFRSFTCDGCRVYWRGFSNYQNHSEVLGSMIIQGIWDHNIGNLPTFWPLQEGIGLRIRAQLGLRV